MLQMFRHHSALAWLLVFTQVFAVVIGPAALVECVEADGSSHIEWVTPECCGSTVVGSEATEMERAVTFVQEDSCREGGCIDEPVRTAEALRRRGEHENEGVGSLSRCDLVMCSPPLALAVDLDRVAVHPNASADLPRCFDLAKRSVVLLL